MRGTIDRWSLAIGAALAIAGCATPKVHEGPTALERPPLYALARTPKRSSDRFEHFWIREGSALSRLSWSTESAAVGAAPAGLLGASQLLFDDAFRHAADGPITSVTVTFFAWSASSLGNAGTTVGVEVVGRDRRRQILFMGSDHFSVPAGSEEPAVAAARELIRRLEHELGAQPGG